MKNKKYLTIFFALISFTAISFYTAHAFASKSEAFLVSKEFIEKNEQIKLRVGLLKKIELALYGYSIRFEGPNGRADLKIYVEGQKEEGVVYIRLERNLGVWKILGANFFLDNEAPISLVK